MKVKIPFAIACIFLLVTFWNPVLAEENQPAKAKMGLDYLKDAGDQRFLTANLKSRVDKRYQPVQGQTISLYIEESGGLNLLGSVITDQEGIANLQIPANFKETLNSMYEFRFLARLENNSDFVAKEKELIIREAFLDVDFIVRDSIKLIQASVKERDSVGTRLPTEDVEIKFLVERPFSRLPIGGAYNIINEEGTATIEFPDDLPGDSMGHIIVFVKIEDSDVYGNIEKMGDVIWGVPTVFDDATTARSLWAAGANAPYSLLVLVNSLIVAVWGIMLFIVIRIYQIKGA